MSLPSKTNALVLLITRKNELLPTIQAALPATVVVQRLADVSEAEACLTSLDDPPLTTIILLHNSNARRIARNYHRLHRSGLVAGIPQIAILSNPEDRRFILETGLDDYLLLPLIPAEVNARLEVYFRCSQSLLDSMAEVVEQLMDGIRPTTLWEQSLQTLGKTFNAPSGWALLAEESEFGRKIILTGGYNLPPLLTASGEDFESESIIPAILASIQEDNQPMGRHLSANVAPKDVHGAPQPGGCVIEASALDGVTVSPIGVNSILLAAFIGFTA
jgi:hypothetical protein